MVRHEPVEEWRVHVGAHKTATTHMQTVLAAHREALGRAGVDYLPLERVRAHAMHLVLHPLWRRAVSTPLFARRFADKLERCRLRGRVVLVSDENWLGAIAHPLHPTPYPEARARLRVIATLRRRAPLRVFLAIRGFDRLLPSAYAQALRHSPAPVALWDGLEARVRTRPPRWVEVVARVRRAIGGATLSVWTYEDYAADPARITAAYVGHPCGMLPSVERPSSTRSPSAEAIAAVEALAREGRHDDWATRVGEIFEADIARGDGPPYRPFALETVEALERAYEADRAALAALTIDAAERETPVA